MKLNVGCGSDIKEGYINMDSHGGDVTHDMNNIPWPFEDNQFDIVLMKHVLEDFSNAAEILDEVHRITKGTIKIICPSEGSAWNNIHHKKVITASAIQSWCKSTRAYGLKEKARLTKAYYSIICEKGVAWYVKASSALCTLLCNIVGWRIVDYTFIKYIAAHTDMHAVVTVKK